MIYYIYDGSFEGLLTAIYDSYYQKQTPCDISAKLNPQISLFDENIYIKTDNEKFEKVYNSIRQKISSDVLNNVYNVYLSNYEYKGILIFNYLKLGWKVGYSIDDYISNESVLNVQRISRRVQKEYHLFLGIVRFKRMEGDFYYASIEPDNNITELLAPHFSTRLSDQRWVIHDIKRGIAAVYDLNKWYILDLKSKPDFELQANENDFQGLWKKYFNSIAIKSRINPKLQRSFMPKRYWRHLTEKN